MDDSRPAMNAKTQQSTKITINTHVVVVVVVVVV
jgi:hypothetical protein